MEKIFRSCTDFGPRFDITNLLKYLCVSRSSVVAHDEVIILSFPCDLSARRTGLDVFHLLTCILKRILEKIAVVLRCLVNEPVIKWFVQRCTHQYYMQG